MLAELGSSEFREQKTQFWWGCNGLCFGNFNLWGESIYKAYGDFLISRDWKRLPTNNNSQFTLKTTPILLPKAINTESVITAGKGIAGYLRTSGVWTVYLLYLYLILAQLRQLVSAICVEPTIQTSSMPTSKQQG